MGLGWPRPLLLPPTLPGLDKPSGHSLSIGLGLKGTHLMQKQIKALREGRGLPKVNHRQSLSSSSPSKAGPSAHSRASQTEGPC